MGSAGHLHHLTRWYLGMPGILHTVWSVFTPSPHPLEGPVFPRHKKSLTSSSKGSSKRLKMPPSPTPRLPGVNGRWRRQGRLGSDVSGVQTARPWVGGASSKHTCAQGSLKIKLVSKEKKTFIKLSISCFFFLRNQLIYLPPAPRKKKKNAGSREKGNALSPKDPLSRRNT